MISTTRSPFRPLALFMGVMTLAWASMPQRQLRCRRRCSPCWASQ